MKRIILTGFLFITAVTILLAGDYNIDDSEQINLTGIDRIRFIMEGPKCALCLQTGTLEYSFSGSTRGSRLGLTLEGDLSSNKRRALPELLSDKRGRTLTVRLYEENHLFVGLVQSGSVHFHADIPIDFDGEVEIATSSGDSTVNDLVAGIIRIKSSSGDIEAKGIEGDRIEIRVSSGKIRSDELRAADLLMIDASSGDINLGEAAAGDMDLTAHSGRMELGRLSCSGDLQIEAHSGRISADVIEAGNAGIESHSGNITIGSLSAGSIDMKASSGSIEVALPSIEGPMDIESSSGDISLSLPAGEGFEVDLKVSSGRIRSDFKLLGDVSSSRENQVRGEANGGGPLIKMRASSGDIEIKRN